MRTVATSAFLIAFVLLPAPCNAQQAITAEDVHALRPGHYVWDPELSLTGAITIFVDLSAQRAHVYRGAVRIGASTISSGKRGHSTPAGEFTILEKQRFHRSNLYHRAPMPFMQRLTWGGVALHAGHVPGYRASHGCIRLPMSFAKALYGETEYGTRVIVAHEGPDSSPEFARDMQEIAVHANDPPREASAAGALPPGTAQPRASSTNGGAADGTHHEETGALPAAEETR